MAADLPPVAFIGLGAMGFGMATHLVHEGYAVTGFDVHQPTLDRFARAGGLTAATPAAAVAGKPLCVCMVATAQQAQAVLLDGAAPALQTLPPRAVVLLASTVPCAYVQGLQRDLAARGRPDVLLVDCPVSGGAARAADGTLSIMAGASDEALAEARPLLRAMADPDKLYIVAGGVGAGSNLKMCHQVLAASQILSASEAMGFADHLGLDLERARQAVVASEGWSWMLEHRAPRMLHPDFLPLASAVAIIIKDTSIITAEARRAGFPSPMTSTAEQVYLTALGRGYGGDDDSSLIRLYNEGKGTLGALRGTAEGAQDKLALVVDLLKGIHLCSAAETLAFAHRLGLDLAQVLDLCVDAAGGSSILRAVGPEMIQRLGGTTAEGGHAVEGDGAAQTLADVARRLGAAVAEAQLVKCPAFLGAQASTLMGMALRRGGEPEALRQASIVSMWL